MTAITGHGSTTQARSSARPDGSGCRNPLNVPLAPESLKFQLDHLLYLLELHSTEPLANRWRPIHAQRAAENYVNSVLDILVTHESGDARSLS
jgi:hypothetical protein